MCSRPLRRWLSLSLCALFALAFVSGCASWRSTGPVRDASSQRLPPAGPVVGSMGQYGSHVWRGIPYAKPPVGDLRWRAPQPAERWSEWLEADRSGEACSQPANFLAGDASGDNELVGAEDCLYLDVYAPAFAPDQVPAGDARIPVMVWIHGGGNVVGRAGFYDGGRLAATHDVVVVAINYRLGALGWFRHESLRAAAEGPAEASGNFGTLDLIRSLEWVQRNVAAFGGDPDNVTIFGESAGGTNVFTLMLSPLAEGLFHRAIVQSGGTGVMEGARAEEPFAAREDGHRNSSSEVLGRLLEKQSKSSGELSAPELASFLRATSVRDLMAAYQRRPSGGADVPTLFRDGFVLPDEAPMDLFARGAYNQVPVVLGSNRDENKLFMVEDPAYVSRSLGGIPRPHDPDVYQATAEYQSRAWKARGVDEPASLMHAVQGDSVYAYRFDWDEEPKVLWLYDGGEMIGAAHGLEIPFVFGHFDVGPQSGSVFTRRNREGREQLSSEMMSYWAEFAHKGRPGRGRASDQAQWWAWDGSDRRAPKFIVLDTLASEGIRMDTRVESLPAILEALVADPRLVDARSKCQVLRQLANWEDISRSEYQTIDGALCAPYALDDYPWPESGTLEAEASQ
jgi:para-nitrobenzyl esterase